MARRVSHWTPFARRCSRDAARSSPREAGGGGSVVARTLTRSDVVTRFREQLHNCRVISKSKTGKDRDEWNDDAEFYETAIAMLTDIGEAHSEEPAHCRAEVVGSSPTPDNYTAELAVELAKDILYGRSHYNGIAAYVRMDHAVAILRALRDQAYLDERLTECTDWKTVMYLEMRLKEAWLAAWGAEWRRDVCHGNARDIHDEKARLRGENITLRVDAEDLRLSLAGVADGINECLRELGRFDDPARTDSGLRELLWQIVEAARNRFAPVPAERGGGE